jgi:hypothetical protein
VLHGPPAAIVAGLAVHLDAGADHVGIQVLPRPGEGPMAGLRTLATQLSRVSTRDAASSGNSQGPVISRGRTRIAAP